MPSMNIMKRAVVCGLLLAMSLPASSLLAAKKTHKHEMTPDSQKALKRGLEWLARKENQGPKGNWGSNDLGLVSMGALAFLADGHMPGRGRYGKVVDRALNFVLKNAKPSGLLNMSSQQRDMYNHGLATFVLGQAHGMTLGGRRSDDGKDLNTVLDKALKLIAATQCQDGGWAYNAQAQARGHDLSLAVMQAKALRSAVDSGLDVPPEVVQLAIQSVREHYTPHGVSRSASEEEQRRHPGAFTYSKGGGNATMAMASAGVVCMQEYGQYDDWRIAKSMELVTAKIKAVQAGNHNGKLPFDAYTLMYVGQALYQVGGKDWDEYYPILRDKVVAGQILAANSPSVGGSWQAGGHVSGKPGALYGTAVACFVLAMPNRYLPILQEGRIKSLQEKFKKR
jgi:hypothetical protein